MKLSGQESSFASEVNHNS